jgi:hypothetical protein
MAINIEWVLIIGLVFFLAGGWYQILLFQRLINIFHQLPSDDQQNHEE